MAAAHTQGIKYQNKIYISYLLWFFNLKNTELVKTLIITMEKIKCQKK